MGDFLRELAGEGKTVRRDVGPVGDGVGGWRSVERGVHFHGRKVPGVKSEALIGREMFGVKDAAPVVVGPGAGSDFENEGRDNGHGSGKRGSALIQSHPWRDSWFAD